MHIAALPLTAARANGVLMTTLEQHPVIDLTIDGADEVDEDGNLLKGHGGALLREKIVASCSRRLVIAVDSSKLVTVLGKTRALPVEVVDFGWNTHRDVLQEIGAFGALGPPAGLGLLLAAPTIADYGTQEQIDLYVRDIVTGRQAWCQLFSEPGAGSDLAGLTAKAVQDGDEYVVNGQKVWTSRLQHSELMILLTRTTPADQVARKADGMSILLEPGKE